MNTSDRKHIFIAFFKVAQEWRGVIVDGAYATVCLFPLSPQGAKARRATNTRRENGCSECSSRWDESSVLVRYVLLISSPVIFSFLASHSLLLLLSCILYSHFVNLHFFTFTMFQFTSASLDFFFCLSQTPNFMSTFYLSFDSLSLVDILAKISSTFCFHYTLESKK